MLAAQSALAAEWTGFYIGIHAGGAFGDTDYTNVSDNTVNLDLDPGETITLEPDGVLGGAQLGYNHQWTNWLFGIEVSGSGLDFDDTASNPFVGGAEEFVSTEIEWLATAAARLGWAWQNSLLYVKGGYATGDVNALYVDPGAGNDAAALSYSTSETHGGWVAGAGIEHQIGDNVSFGVEYNYIDLGEQDHTGVNGAFTATNDIDVQLHTVTARLNYSFSMF